MVALRAYENCEVSADAWVQGFFVFISNSSENGIIRFTYHSCWGGFHFLKYKDSEINHKNMYLSNFTFGIKALLDLLDKYYVLS